MNITINSRKLNQALTFSRPGPNYIYVDINGQPGTLGRQICSGGSLMGGTITYAGSDEAEFARICRNWYRSYIASRWDLA